MVSPTEPEQAHAPSPPRRVGRPRGLPGGRAVVGALLVAAAAVAVFAAYLDATADPSTRYLVVAEPIPAGTVIEDVEVARELFATAPLALVDAVAAHAVPAGQLEDVVGRTVLTPLAGGELLRRSALAGADRPAGQHVLSFALPASAAVGGAISAGERIDVLATVGRGGSASTAYVVRDVPVIDVAAGTGMGSSVLLTVALSGVEEVQALGHAVNTADVFVVGVTTAGDDGGTPAPYTGPATTVDDGDDDEVDLDG